MYIPFICSFSLSLARSLNSFFPLIHSPPSLCVCVSHRSIQIHIYSLAHRAKLSIYVYVVLWIFSVLLHRIERESTPFFICRLFKHVRNTAEHQIHSIYICDVELHIPLHTQTFRLKSFMLTRSFVHSFIRSTVRILIACLPVCSRARLWIAIIL